MRLNSFPQRQQYAYSTEYSNNPQQSEDLLYHKDIGFPDDADMPPGFNSVMQLNYGTHAREESMKDRYGNMQLPHRIDLTKGDIFEIAVDSKNIVTKIVVRFSYDKEKDICLAIIPKTRFVKTVWFNLKSDQHKTLNRSKYAVPKKPIRR